MSDTTFYYLDSTQTTSSDTNLTQSSYDRTKTLVSVEVGTLATSLGDSCFLNSSGLSSLTFSLPSSVTSIGSLCFLSCPLTSITLPNTVRSLNDSCFYNCYLLTSIMIPSSVTSFGSQIFRDDSNLISISFEDQHNLISVGNNNFFYQPSGVVAVTYYNTVDYADLSTASKSLQLQFPPGTTYNYLATPPCFKSGTKILTDKGYKLIQDLRKGDLVKTLLNDYQPIVMIGKRDMYHSVSQNRTKDQLFKCSSSQYPEVFEDLVITGHHSILVGAFTSAEQREKTSKELGRIYITDQKYRLPACVDERASVYETPGTYTVYHIALENDNYYMNYGIYANGLLVETCSKKYLKELSGMELIHF